MNHSFKATFSGVQVSHISLVEFVSTVFHTFSSYRVNLNMGSQSSRYIATSVLLDLDQLIPSRKRVLATVLEWFSLQDCDLSSVCFSIRATVVPQM